MDWLNMSSAQKIALISAIIESINDDFNKPEESQVLDGYLRKPKPLRHTEPRFLAALAADELKWIKKRQNFIDSDVLGSASWNILLDLYVNYVNGRRISVTSACIGSQAPPTTALRWLQVLDEADLISSSYDPGDGRIRWVSLTDRGLVCVERYLIEKANSGDKSFSRAFHWVGQSDQYGVKAVVR